MHVTDETLAASLSDQLEGETLTEAVYARVDTGVGFTRMLTPLGNYFIARPAARSAAKKLTDATDVPLDAAVVLGLSDTALHVWSADPMLNQVHDHLGHVPLERISAMHVTPGRKWQQLSITLDGGQTIELQARGASHALQPPSSRSLAKPRELRAAFTLGRRKASACGKCRRHRRDAARAATAKTTRSAR